MCALQDGQIVEVAAPLTCCFRLQSKHSTTKLRCRFQRSSNLPRIEELPRGGFSSLVGRFGPCVVANCRNGRPHWRQLELLAASYSICVLLQCWASALAFNRDVL